MAIQFQFRRDVATVWTSANPVLAEGEIGLETDTLKMKMGNGTTAWTSLNYVANVKGDTGLTGTDGADGADGTDGNQIVGINAQEGTTYTLVLADAGKLIRCSNPSAITLTVPKNLSVAFPVNTVITIEQQGAGRVTIAPVDGDVTLNKYDGLKIAGQYAMLQIIKVATNVWTCIGGVT